MKPAVLALPIVLAAVLSAQQATPAVTTEAVRSQAKLCTVQAKDADVSELVWAIAKQASANVVLAPEVRGRVSVDLVDVPWCDALASTVGALGYRVDERLGILRVVPGPAEPAPRVDFAFENADVVKVIETIAKLAGANIVLAPEVHGTISLRLRDVAWRDALDVVAETLGYVTEDLGNGVVHVAPPPATMPAKPLSLALEDADVRKVIDAVARFAEANIVVAPEVEGRVTIRVRDVPWPDALRAAVENLGFTVETDASGITRVRAPR